MLWQQKVDDLRGPRKNSHVYQEMAAEMQMQGYDVNSSSVKIKIDNLTAKYRKAKAGMGTTGGSPASWHLFEQVHQIIGGFSINNVEELIEESFEDSMSSSPTNISPLSPSLPQLSPSPSCSSPLPSGSGGATLPPSISSAATSTRSGKQKQMDRLVTICEGIQSNFSEAMEKFTKSNDELVEIEKAKLVAMQELQRDARRLTDGLLYFLNRF
ncbi:PREDICTED: myb/SANT-like DNA-binding domain-containing protein 1 [Rhagoletis zephyria]|uniref:myb/SANT-like DNA-binding domain-containing protein 1 n=1 Tax=Rhagoletis zephyria TaxID=28612 RepID=UPI0008117B95|nr:PREDICTED: myb/SANT-like DNA-binding domain-containing protein 1 [Rhagoletis zephyria]XP_017469287.1 PREDICTED: myb/SANT-like DNA-binding domain-containing protein 1 [Rhagoletis zephyria]